MSDVSAHNNFVQSNPQNNIGVFDPRTATYEEIRRALDELNASLNPEQKRAAETVYGPVMVIAGAGAGKTKTLIHRVASMLIQNVYPENILAVTFTAQAASEIKHRLEQMIGENGQYVHAGTFHSIVFREILKKYPEHQYLEKHGINMSECAIFDEKESESVFKEAIKELSDEDKELLEEAECNTYSKIEKVISAHRARGNSHTEFESEIIQGSKNELRDRIISSVWASYTEKCRKLNGMDFDDILVHANKMLSSDRDLSFELSERFKYIMLDEYQDTNIVQMMIMDHIAQHHKNICVVGDEKQSIYKFRYADINVILGFEKRYNNPAIINMNKNYRSYPNVATYFNALASNMQQKLSDGQLSAQRTIEEDPETLSKRKVNSVAMVEFANDDLEAEAIRKAVIRDIERGTKGNEIAVLYRNRTLKNKLERQLVEFNVSYNIVGDREFFQKAEVKDAVALARFVFHPWDSIAGFRVLKATNMKISDDAAKKAMAEQGINVNAFLKQQSTKRLIAKKKGQDHPDLTKSAKKASPFVALCQKIRESAEFYDSPEFIHDCLAKVWDIYMKPGIEKKNENPEEKINNVSHIFDRFKKSLEKGFTVSEAIEDLCMKVDQTAIDDMDNDNKIQLMTLHASKGLEFDNVYVLGLDAQTTHGDDPSHDEIEESRRLTYVGMTRAKKKLSMSYSVFRIHNGQALYSNGSPFIDEIERTANKKRYIFKDPSAEKENVSSYTG